MILRLIFYFCQLFKTKQLSLKDTSIPGGHLNEMPLPGVSQPRPTAPPHPLRWGGKSQKLPIITLCLSTVHPICAVIISVFEALMAALPVKIMGPIIFNELHQEVSMGLLSLEQRRIGKQHCFLVIKMAVSLCEAKKHPFSFSAPLDLKGPRKAV